MSDGIAAPELSPRPAQSVAPAWHTAALLVWLLGFSALGAFGLLRISAGQYTRVLLYLVSVVVEWVTVGFIALSMRRSGVRLRDLIGGSWPKPGAVLRDLGLAVGFLVAADAVLAMMAIALRSQRNSNVLRFLPGTRLELAGFVLLCLTAGVCEELIFRGYLQRQLAGLTGSARAGLVLQGVAFGAAHGYQGPKSMVMIAVFGCLFGGLARWRRSLRPGMVAHFMQDSIIGIAEFWVRR